MKSISIHTSCECGKRIDVEISVSEEPYSGLYEEDVLELLDFAINAKNEYICTDCMRNYFLQSKKSLQGRVEV